MGLIDCEFDFSDIDQSLRQGQWDVIKTVIDIGDESVRYAEDNGDYEDHTLKLRTSNKFDVDEDANLTLYNDAKSPQGYPYASNVESKGYDVLSGAALFAERRLKEEFE